MTHPTSNPTHIDTTQTPTSPSHLERPHSPLTALHLSYTFPTRESSESYSSLNGRVASIEEPTPLPEQGISYPSSPLSETTQNSNFSKIDVEIDTMLKGLTLPLPDDSKVMVINDLIRALLHRQSTDNLVSDLDLAIQKAQEGLTLQMISAYDRATLLQHLSIGLHLRNSHYNSNQPSDRDLAIQTILSTFALPLDESARAGLMKTMIEFLMIRNLPASPATQQSSDLEIAIHYAQYTLTLSMSPELRSEVSNLLRLAKKVRITQIVHVNRLKQPKQIQAKRLTKMAHVYHRQMAPITSEHSVNRS